MKKSEVVKLLSTVLTRYNTGTPWYNERKHAEEVLNMLEELNILRPTHQKTIIRRDLELIPYEDMLIVEGWEDE
jgi:hypothetical protein